VKAGARFQDGWINFAGGRHIHPGADTVELQVKGRSNAPFFVVLACENQPVKISNQLCSYLWKCVLIFSLIVIFMRCFSYQL
jgi:hypothetical protein